MEVRYRHRNVFHSSLQGTKIHSCDFVGPLEMAVAAVLPDETNHDEVEGPWLWGFVGGKGRANENKGKKERQNRRQRTSGTRTGQGWWTN